MTSLIKINCPYPVTSYMYRMLKVILCADFSGTSFKYDTNFKAGVSNKSPEYLKKFPLGQMPSLESDDGFLLSQSNAIVNYVSSDEFLRLHDKKSNALVNQFINLSSTDVNTFQIALTYPAFGLALPDKAKCEVAKTKLIGIMSYLNDYLATRTYLVDERITAADVCVFIEFSNLVRLCFDPNTLSTYPHFKRWFTTILNQPVVQKYMKDFEFCTKPIYFNSERYYQMHPEEKKKLEKKETGKKETKPVEKKEEKVEKPAETKKKVDLFAGLKPSSFVLDDFKRSEANNDARSVALPYLWEHFDNEGFSFWLCEYKYANEFSKKFMLLNFINNTIDGVQSLSKHAYGSFLVHGEEKNFKLTFLILCRGKEFIFGLPHDACFDAEIFDVKGLDITADKKLIEDYIAKDVEIDGKKPVHSAALR